MGRHYSDNYTVTRHFFLAYIHKHEEFHKSDLFAALIKVHDTVSKNIFDTVFKTFVNDNRIFTMSDSGFYTPLRKKRDTKVSQQLLDEFEQRKQPKQSNVEIRGDISKSAFIKTTITDQLLIDSSISLSFLKQRVKNSSDQYIQTITDPELGTILTNLKKKEYIKNGARGIYLKGRLFNEVKAAKIKPSESQQVIYDERKEKTELALYREKVDLIKGQLIQKMMTLNYKVFSRPEFHFDKYADLRALVTDSLDLAKELETIVEIEKKK